MRKLITIYSIFIIIASLASCNNKENKKKDMKPERPLLNYEISFNVYDKDKLDSFKDPSSLPKEQLNEITLSLIDALDNYKPDTSGEYYLYYKNYNTITSASYLAMGHAAKQDLQKKLQDNQTLKMKSNFNEQDKSAIDNYYFIKSCSKMFKKDWLISPNLSFSSVLIDNVLKDFRELLYNQYQYDNDPNNQAHLPIINQLDKGDETVIKPHYIDSKNAKVMLIVLNKYKKSDNVLLNQEVELFKSLLNKVIAGTTILALNNHSM